MKLTVKTHAVQESLKQKIARAKDPSGWLARVGYPMYQGFQRMRWMSENASEGSPWPALNPQYADRKRTMFASYPGAGTKMMIATGRLQQSVIGPSGEHRRLISGGKMTISTTVPYAKYANEARAFFPLSGKSKADIRRAFKRWAGGK